MHRDEEKETEESFAEYKDILYRVAFSNMKNKADAEDVVQEAFYRYLNLKPEFENKTHAKNWFVRVVINLCRDIQKSAWFSKRVALDEVPEYEMKNFTLPFIREDEMLRYVMELPENYRNPLYLFYYEDYSVKEIAEMLELEEGTVKTRLRRGRGLIKERILFGRENRTEKEGGENAD